MKNQFGRSMIEMLGVLAIIGVLSIGGVATFQYAMTKDKANKLIYDINLLREQTLTNAADVPAENFEPESGYQMSSQYGEGGIVSIMIDDLDKDVCERLLSMRFEDLRFLHAEQNTDILSCEGTPSFRAVFGLGDNAIIDEDACVIPCDSNHECHERRCCPKLADGICSATASGCPTQVADDGTPCGTNQVCDDGECVCGLECEGEFVPNSACDACECGLACANGGTPNESCTACENCDNSYGGTYCEVCEQNCQNSGTPIQNCSACECVNSWEGDKCETCGLDCQNGGTPNEDCSACDCPPNTTGDDCETCANFWTGDNCETCGLDCQNGGTPNEDCSACDCVAPWSGDNCTENCPEGMTGENCDVCVSEDEDECFEVCRENGLLIDFNFFYETGSIRCISDVCESEDVNECVHLCVSNEMLVDFDYFNETGIIRCMPENCNEMGLVYYNGECATCLASEGAYAPVLEDGECVPCPIEAPIWSYDEDKCVTCPEGTIFNSMMSSCQGEDLCPEGYRFVESADWIEYPDGCIPDDGCPKGTFASTNGCTSCFEKNSACSSDTDNGPCLWDGDGCDYSCHDFCGYTTGVYQGSEVVNVTDKDGIVHQTVMCDC